MRTKQEMLQELVQLHTSMLAHGWTLTRTESEDDGEEKREVREYTGTAILTTDGSGIYDATAGLQVCVNCVTVVYDGYDEYMSRHVGLQHDFEEEEGVELYTDNGLEHEASKLTGLALCFTESGMQDEGYMSME